jgi:hypothetical protein
MRWTSVSMRIFPASAFPKRPALVDELPLDRTPNITAHELT